MDKKENIEETLAPEEETISISKEEYEKLQEAKKSDDRKKANPDNIYNYVNIPIKTLDKVIIFGIACLVGAIIIGVILGNT